MRLSGKIALITGGANGIGLATARKFAQEGATPVLCDVQPGALERAVAELRGLAPKCSGMQVDVTQRVQVDAMVAEVLRHHGRIDVLVNNAGVTRDARLQKMTEEQFDLVINVNLKGVFHCTQAVAAPMLQQSRGVILNASSVVGLYGNFGQTNYAATKAGVIGFTKTWARELGPKGIRVNAVCPGFIATDILASIPDKVLEQMHDACWLRRLGQPEEIANVYAFLASDEASYINGAVLEASGGMSL